MNFWEVLGNYLLYYLQNNLPVVAITIAMIAILWRNTAIGKRDVSGYRDVIILIFVMTFFDSFDHYVEGLKETASAAMVMHRFVTSTIAYILKPGVPLFVLFGVCRSHKKRITWQWIPEAIYALVFTINFVIPTKFYGINELNEFYRASGWEWIAALPFIVSGGYLLMVLLESYSIFTDKKVGELIAVISMSICCFGAYVIESVWTVFNLGNQMCAIGVLFFYLFLVIKYTKIDPLTGLFNRASFYANIDVNKRYSAVISIDMNNLKYYNDNFGHDKGDEALAVIGTEIRKISNKNIHPYRMGGDEFLILCFNMSEEQVKIVISKLTLAINRSTEYDVAIGYSYRDNNDPLSYLVTEADKMMYEQKAQMKKDIFRVKKNKR